MELKNISLININFPNYIVDEYINNEDNILNNENREMSVLKFGTCWCGLTYLTQCVCVKDVEKFNS